jgi:hypothetical protein
MPQRSNSGEFDSTIVPCIWSESYSIHYLFLVGPKPTQLRTYADIQLKSLLYSFQTPSGVDLNEKIPANQQEKQLNSTHLLLETRNEKYMLGQYQRSNKVELIQQLIRIVKNHIQFIYLSLKYPKPTSVGKTTWISGSKM